MKKNNVTEKTVSKISPYLSIDEARLLDKDIWCPEEDLGLQVNKHAGKRFLNFSNIQQSWLKTRAKQYILYKRIQGTKFGTLHGYIWMFNKLSKLINTESINSFSDINEDFIDLFIQQVSQYSESYRKLNVTYLKGFLSAGNIEGWFDIPTYTLNGKSFRDKAKLRIKYIPDEVLKELDNNIGLEWLRAKMQPKALAMGFCARPALLKPCPHANACMSCEHFRLDEDDLPALKQHLSRNQKLKNESQKLGFIRQIKAIEQDENQLVTLINSLKSSNE